MNVSRWVDSIAVASIGVAAGEVEQQVRRVVARVDELAAAAGLRARAPAHVRGVEVVVEAVGRPDLVDAGRGRRRRGARAPWPPPAGTAGCGRSSASRRSRARPPRRPAPPRASGTAASRTGCAGPARPARTIASRCRWCGRQMSTASMGASAKQVAVVGEPGDAELLGPSLERGLADVGDGRDADPVRVSAIAADVRAGDPAGTDEPDPDAVHPCPFELARSGRSAAVRHRPALGGRQVRGHHEPGELDRASEVVVGACAGAGCGRPTERTDPAGRAAPSSSAGPRPPNAAPVDTITRRHRCSGSCRPSRRPR